MAKGKAADNKGAAGKGGKGKAEEEGKGGKIKGAQQINVRHILVRVDTAYLLGTLTETHLVRKAW
jgi:hypothetical protein